MTPTTKEQIEWLDLIKSLLHSDNAPMILAIKENLIAVRNMDVATERELLPMVKWPDIKEIFKPDGEATVDYPSLGLSTEKPVLSFFEEAELKEELDFYIGKEQEDRETSFQTIATLKKWRNDPNQNT